MTCLLFVALPFTALAQLNCPIAASVPTTTTDPSVQTEAAVDAFKGLFKMSPISAKISASASLAHKDVLAKFPNADVVALRQQELSYVCQLLNKDTSLSAKQKISIFQKVGEGIPVDSSDKPKSPQRKVKNGSERRNDNSAPRPAGPPTQSCPNGICIGGDNYGNPQIYNAPQPIAFTPGQLEKIGSGMVAFSGRKVSIITDGINDETMGLSGSLKSALEMAGLTAEVHPSMMTVMLGGRRPPPGLSFVMSEDEYDATEHLAAILSASGFLPPGKRFNAQIDPHTATFEIYVGSTTH